MPTNDGGGGAPRAGAGAAPATSAPPRPAPRPYRRAYVEISNVCNLACDFCPPVERRAQQMTPALFEKLAGEIAPLADEVCLHLMGEPLNHPEFEAVLAACVRYALPVNLTTNGLLLTGRRRTLALAPIVRQVNISAHSFAANFPGQDPAPYVERLLSFLRAALAQRPELYVNIRLWDLGDVAATAAANVAVRLGLEAEFSVPLAAPDVRRKKSVRLAGRISAHFDSRFVWPSPALPERSQSGFCHALGSHFGVHADGRVVPCCLDKEAVLGLGSAVSAPLTEALASPRAQRMRQGFARGELVEDLCRRCPFIARFDGKAQRRRGERRRV